MIKNPFVAEVVRIIKADLFRDFLSKRRTDKTIILVSPRFHTEATCELMDQPNPLGDVFQLQRCKRHPDRDGIRICRLLTFPAYWLRDYEFEIRN